MEDIGYKKGDVSGGHLSRDGGEVMFSGVLSKQGVKHSIANGSLRGHSAYLAEQAIENPNFNGFKVNSVGTVNGKGRTVSMAVERGSSTLVNSNGTVNGQLAYQMGRSPKPIRQ